MASQKESTVLFVGYQAEGSLGRKLQQGAKAVRLFGEEIAVHAEISMLHGTSGHADQAGLLRWLEGFREKPTMIYVNHGDDGSCETFRKLLKDRGYTAEAPFSGTEYDLITNTMVVYTQGKPIDRVKTLRGTARANAVFTELLAAAESLLTLVKKRRGCTNKDNAKLTAQIRNLIQKWK